MRGPHESSLSDMLGGAGNTERSIRRSSSGSKEEVHTQHGLTVDQEKGIETLEVSEHSQSLGHEIGIKTASENPNLVSWDGPDDPQNPKTWSFKRKWAATSLVSLITFMSPISSSIIAPSLATIGDELRVHSMFELQLIFSIIMLAFVIGPLFIAPMSEVYGRVIVLQLANAFFLAFNLGCGFAQTKGEMMAFRFLSGLGACAPQSIGGGILGDLWKPEERGQAVALYSLAPMLGPALGPLLGAWIEERTTWRWSFWSIVMFGFVVQVLIYFAMPETFAPRILYWKAQRLRKQTGNHDLHTEYELRDRSFGNIIRKAGIRPFRLLFTQPIVQFLALWFSLLYGITYLMLSTFPQLWTAIYHESIGIGGLNYISIMIGLGVGAQIAGRFNNWTYHYLKARSADQQGRPEFRVPGMFIAVTLTGMGLFIYGWSAQARTHWIVPNIGAAIFSAGGAFAYVAIQTYAIDTYTLYAASALGAIAVSRSLFAFGFPLFAPQLYRTLGWGWGNSLLAFIVLGFGLSTSMILWAYGERLRKASPYAVTP